MEFNLREQISPHNEKKKILSEGHPKFLAVLLKKYKCRNCKSWKQFKEAPDSNIYDYITSSNVT